MKLTSLKSLFVAIAVTLPTYTYAEMAFEETLSYINKFLRDDVSYEHNYTGQWVKSQRNHLLEHDLGCYIRLTSKLNSEVNSITVINLMGVTISYSVPNNPNIRPMSMGNISITVNNPPKKTFGRSYDEHLELQKIAKKMGYIKDLMGDGYGNATDWRFDKSITVSNENDAQRLTNAFKNLQKTCPADPFAN